MADYLHQALPRFIRLILSFAFAYPIGWNREREEGWAGVRTFPLVSLGSCGLILVVNSLHGTPDASAHVLQGLITGIGFVGGGAILKSNQSVHGTATAASIWNVAVVGAAVGFGFYDIAFAMALLNYLALRFLHPMNHVDNPQ